MAKYDPDWWAQRDLPESDYLLGGWLTTTSKLMVVGPKGVGKSMFAVGLAHAIASGGAFLHWEGSGAQRRVLCVDAEMSVRTTQKRVLAEVARSNRVPAAGLRTINGSDFPDMPPVDTPEGQAFVDRLIAELGGFDAVIFDNVQAMTSYGLAGEKSWGETCAWAQTLADRKICQVWLHHTGHLLSREYGTSRRGMWMDADVLMRDGGRRENETLAFTLHFDKARERDPDNWEDFEDVRVAMTDDRWTWSVVEDEDRFDGRLEVAMSVLQRLSHEEGDFAHRVSVDSWVKAAEAAGLGTSDAERKRLLAQLKRRGRVVVVGTGVGRGRVVWAVGADRMERIEEGHGRTIN